MVDKTEAQPHWWRLDILKKTPANWFGCFEPENWMVSVLLLLHLLIFPRENFPKTKLQCHLHVSSFSSWSSSDVKPSSLVISCKMAALSPATRTVATSDESAFKLVILLITCFQPEARISKTYLSHYVTLLNHHPHLHEQPSWKTLSSSLP